ncbi:DUF6134 family protein [Variovorax paradoxus]|jgi:hypothetical protein|uniref:DUF6134 family protein n=1 Tax=Variovorax paradoxus TaxID=34073 RepID=UPI002480FCD8|nr:DUF6134 family protein [Variovorax paradoxus]WGT63068.1 DUF6134 family protein [Variovorax paradoxus]
MRTACRRAVACLAVALAVLPAAAAAAGESTFSVFLDDTPIGEHRFSIGGTEDARSVVSEASFTVKLLGLTVYRYRHRAVEKWRGDCLSELTATTDDDGKASRVRTEAEGDGLAVVTEAGRQALKGCVMSFAYWNPAIQRQPRLLNAQTGRSESVQVSRAGGGTVEVRGRQVAATRWRIDGPAQPIDVWYSAQGEWVGLDSMVDGGRKLIYRLK